MWNRRKRRARAPRTSVPLTADMLNELDKSHMAGVDNYGAEDVYDPDDAWNNEKVTYDRRLVSVGRWGGEEGGVVRGSGVSRTGRYEEGQEIKKSKVRCRAEQGGLVTKSQTW